MKKKGSKKKYVLAVLLVLACAGSADAKSRTLVWNPLTAAQAPPDLKELRVYRGTGAQCTATPPALVQIAVIPKPATGPVPTTYTDATAPDIDGVACYQIGSVDTADNESNPKGNLASKTVNENPPLAVQGLDFH